MSYRTVDESAIHSLPIHKSAVGILQSVIYRRRKTVGKNALIRIPANPGKTFPVEVLNRATGKVIYSSTYAWADPNHPYRTYITVVEVETRREVAVEKAIQRLTALGVQVIRGR